MIPKISVIIITYNQEKLISRSIESVLKQKEYIYELIVSDDSSTDNTWSVINAYKIKYPEIIKPFQNSKNLGIFKHIEKTWEYPTGDIVFYLAGDDEFCIGLFKKTTEFINSNNIDLRNEFFTIYFDYISIKPNGRKKVIRNNLITKHNAIELKIRKLISNRTTGVSINVIKKFKPVEEIGIFTDGLLDIQTQLFSKTNYYIPFSGSIYYKGIGISSIYDSIKAFHSFLLMNRKYLEQIPELNKKDKVWLEYLITRTEFLINPGLSMYLVVINKFFKINKYDYNLKFFLKELFYVIYCFVYLIRQISRVKV